MQTINLFFLFSIFGYIYELILSWIQFHIFKTQLLIGPWLPIYGFGVLISEQINHWLNKKNLSKFKKIVSFYILSVIILTILEAIGGYLIEWIFHAEYWNYSDIPWHIGKYICVPISLGWGLGATICEYIIIPLITPFLKKIPRWVSITFLILILLDHIYLIFKYLI